MLDWWSVTSGRVVDHSHCYTPHRTTQYCSCGCIGDVDGFKLMNMPTSNLCCAVFRQRERRVREREKRRKTENVSNGIGCEPINILLPVIRFENHERIMTNFKQSECDVWIGCHLNLIDAIFMMKHKSWF